MQMKKGFSLIEFLVVLAVVTLLTAMLMPALSNKRAIARQTLCQSNLKQWAVIFGSYTQENDGKFYQAWYSSTPYDHRWMGCVEPYYDEPKILFCPEAVKPVVESPGTGATITTLAAIASKQAWGRFAANDTRPGYAGLAGSYGINSWVSDPYTIPLSYNKYSGSTSDMYWVKASGTGVSDVPLFLDSRWLGGFPGLNTTGSYGTPDLIPETEDTLILTGQGGAMSRYTVNRHGGYSNCLFLDLSVRKVSLKELWGLRWHQKYQIKNAYTRSIFTSWPAWMRNFKDVPKW